MKRECAFLFRALLILSFQTAAFAANPPKEWRPQEKRPLPADIVEATAFQAQPAVIRVGDQITLTLTIRNVSGAPLGNVPWTVVETVGGRFRSCGGGTLANLAPNAPVQVSCTLPAVAGPHTFRGAVDPAGTLGETGGGLSPLNHRLNNSRELTVTVMTAGAIAATEAWLDPQRAKSAARGLAMIMYSRSGDPSRLPGCSQLLESGVDNVRFGIDCRTSAQGDKLNFMLYRGFELRNGWTVAGVETPDVNDSSRARGSRINVKPAPGSTRPYTEIHTYASPFNFKFDTVKIKIRGPYGTDPYQ